MHFSEKGINQRKKLGMFFDEVEHQQGLPVRVRIIEVHTPRRSDELRHPLTHAITQWALYPCLARIANRIKLLLSFLSAQSFQLLRAGRLLEVLAKRRDIDVFGKTVDQTIALR